MKSLKVGGIGKKPPSLLLQELGFDPPPTGKDNDKYTLKNSFTLAQAEEKILLMKEISLSLELWCWVPSGIRSCRYKISFGVSEDVSHCLLRHDHMRYNKQRRRDLRRA